MPSRAYLATDKGVIILSSNDAGAWGMEHGALEEWEVPVVATDPRVRNRVFAGTRGNGVWVSEDAGKTWTKPCFGRHGPGKVRALAIHPSEPDTIYAGTEPIDLFVSRDAGKNWTCFNSLRELPYAATVDYPPGRRTTDVEPHVRDIAIDPENPDIMYLALQVGSVLKTSDGGKTWSVLNNGIDPDVHNLVVDTMNPRQVWAATGGDYARAGKAQGRSLYRSMDGGESWGPMGMESPNDYSTSLAVNSGNPAVLYSGLAFGPPGSWARRPEGAQGMVMRSKDGGQHWESVSAGLSHLTKHFAAAVAVDPTHPSHVCVAFRNGAFCASKDGGDTWQESFFDIAEVQDIELVHS